MRCALLPRTKGLRDERACGRHRSFHQRSDPVPRRTAGVGRPAPRRNGNGLRQHKQSALFRNDDKDPNDDKDRDYSGSINVEGTEYWLSGYVRTSKSGRKFLSLSVKPKQEKPKQDSPSKKSCADDFNDPIPF